jgi:DNA repair ATPase RecN
MTTTLQSTFERLKQLRFPEFAESDELADWQAELSELDGHIAGIATTILAGGHPDSSTIQKQVTELRNQLESITDITDEDREIFAECKNYVDALEEVVQNMKQ